jgi:hypothetical protein
MLAPFPSNGRRRTISQTDMSKLTGSEFAIDRLLTLKSSPNNHEKIRP